jgi:hypothetical protein
VPDNSDTKSLPVLAGELWKLLVTYVKQETVEPIRGLGRFVAVGMASTLALGTGLTLLALAGLRALQTETGATFRGNLTWVPYAACAGGSLLVVAAAAGAVVTGRGRGSSAPSGKKG